MLFLLLIRVATKLTSFTSQSDLGSDTASNYASDVSDTSSVTSSMFDYEYENGRRYHAYRAGQYLLPNDETEQERLDMTHHVFLLTLKGELCATHLDNPQKILDIGTGTGIWVYLSRHRKSHSFTNSKIPGY